MRFQIERNSFYGRKRGLVVGGGGVKVRQETKSITFRFFPRTCGKSGGGGGVKALLTFR